MRSLLLLIITALLSVSATACGDTSKGDSSKKAHSSSSATTTSTAPSTAPSSPTSTQDYAEVDRDKDNDIRVRHDETNNNSALNYGHAASTADTQAITKLVEHYYEAAAHEDGAKACSMLGSSLAEAAVEDYGHGSAGPSYLSTGTTCPAVMALLFRHFHSQLTVELPKLQVTRVRLVGHRGFAIASFATMPEREVPVAREGRTWKVRALLDNELP
jgi:hypothetical protein